MNLLRAGAAAIAALSLAACRGEYHPPGPGLRVLGGSLAVSEAGGTATFAVALAIAPRADVDVDVLAGDASEGLVATGGAHPAAWTTLRFGPSDWDVPRTVTVVGVDDARRDGDVAWAVRLLVAASADGGYAAAPGATVDVVTRDDDTPGIRLSRTAVFTAETGTVADGFAVSLASQPSTPVTVVATSGDPSEGLLSGGPHAIAPAPWIDLVFTPSSWAIPQTVTITAVDDDLLDGGQAYAVTVEVTAGDPDYVALPPQDVAAVNADTDVAELVVWQDATPFSEGSTGSFSVRLAATPAEPVQLPIVCADPAEAWLSSPGDSSSDGTSLLLSFDASNWSTAQLVSIWGRPDYAVDGTKTVAVALGPPQGDPAFAALSQRTLEFTVLDQDAPAAIVPSTGAVSIHEGQVQAFWISLSTVPSEPVTLRVETSDPGIAWLYSGSAESSTPAALTFRFGPEDWRYARSVQVWGATDGTVEGPQGASVTVGPATGDPRYAALSPTVIPVMVADADVPGIEARSTGLSLAEGAAASILVWLTARPSVDVTVPLTSSDAAEALLSAGGTAPARSVALTFTPATWSTGQTVIVHGPDDDAVEPGPPHPFTVTVGPAISTGPYGGLSGPTLQGETADDDPFPDEGTLAAPVDLGGALPWAGTVGVGSSWYRLTGFPDGGIVTIAGALPRVVVSVVEDTLEQAPLCLPTSVDGPFSCAVRLPPGGSFLVQVHGGATDRGSTFTVDAAPFTFAPGGPLPVPDDASAAASGLVLSGVPAGYVTVALFLEIAHPHAGDLDVFVIAPAANEMRQVACSGSYDGADYDRTVLSTSLGLPWICGARPPFAGTFRSAASLPHPADADVNGTWTLLVRDVVGGNAGTLVRWGIAAR